MSEIQFNRWHKVVLTDLLTLRHGYQFRTNDFAESGIKVVKIGQVIGNGLVDTLNCDRVRDDLLKSKKEFLLKEGDVLMSLTGNIGRVGVIKGNFENLLQNYRVGLFIPNEDKLNKEFMRYILESNIVKHQLIDNSNASAQANFGKSDLDKIKIQLPPLLEQKKIAEILSKIDDLIIKKRDLNKKNNLLLKAFIEDLMKGDDNWERVFLSEILLFKNGLNTSKENFGEGIPFVSYKNVYAGGLIKEEDLTECVSLTPSEEDRFCLKRGDILFTRTSETPDEIGFNAVYNTSVPAVFNGFCIRGRPLNDSSLIPAFSSFCFRTNAVLSQMRSLCKYTTRAGISAESLGKVQIMIPPINVQEKIANSLSSLKQLIRVVDRSIYSLENLKHSISQDLLSGRQRVKV